jgi:hypothetical protein
MQVSMFDLISDREQRSNVSPEDQQKVAKQEEERRLLLEHISSAATNTLRDRVAWVLNHYPETRDSDIALLIKYWEIFEPDIYNGDSIHPDDLYKLTRQTSIARERARIQNIYKLFLASPEVRERRGTLSEEEKEKSVEDKPSGWPTLLAYMDESGKNDKQLLVGSLWFLEGGYPILSLNRKILEYRKDRKFEREFHFSAMSRNDLPIYKEMITFFLKEAPAISFKLVSVPTAGIEDKQIALQQLFYHLLIRGVESENETKRAILPRILQIWKDAEETGTDRLLVADLGDRLKQAAHSRFNKELFVDEIRCVSSEHNVFMQVADLFTASANRVLNQSGTQRNHKDDFAEFFLDAIGVGKSFSSNEQVGDMAIHITL